MTGLDVGAEELETVQASLAPTLLDALDIEERRFLLSMKSGDPDWDVLGIEGLEKMPALQWKLLNIRKMDSRKRPEQRSAVKQLASHDMGPPSKLRHRSYPKMRRPQRCCKSAHQAAKINLNQKG